MIPYQNLYIYEISGAIPGSKNLFQEDFIGCWNEEGVSFLFFSQPHDEGVERLIRKKRLSLLSKNVLDYKTWQAGEELKPFKVGNLVVSPPWEWCDIEEGEMLIHLDPCVVFGTGYHPTTRSCLRALWEIYQKEKVKTVLDLGTGSGILALAAAKWGAERVIAIDCNELAVETALRNVFANAEFHRIEVRQGKGETFVEEEAELVSANLHFKAIESLLNRKACFRKRWFILSGIFARDGEEVERRLRGKGVEIVERLEEKGWVTLVGLNRDFRV
jgi:ribosomal protein L11 methyltransferase